MTGGWRAHHDWSVDGVLEGDVHRGVVGLVQLHLHLAVRHTVEADVKLDIYRVAHLDFHLEIQFCSSQLSAPAVMAVTLDPEPTLRLMWTEVL